MLYAFYLISWFNFIVFFFILGFIIGSEDVEYLSSLRETLGDWMKIGSLIMYGAVGSTGALALFIILVAATPQLVTLQPSTGTLPFTKLVVYPDLMEYFRYLYMPLIGVMLSTSLGIVVGHYYAVATSNLRMPRINVPSITRHSMRTHPIGSDDLEVARKIGARRPRRNRAKVKRDIFGFEVSDDGRIILRLKKKS